MGHLTPPTLQTVDISLSGDNHSAKGYRPIHTYTTYDDIRGHVTISTLTRTLFSHIEVSLFGTTRTAHTDHTGPIIDEPHVTHTFLRMAMPIPRSAYPSPSSSNDTYLFNPGCPLSIPFHFVVPARLLPYACRHEHSSASVPEAHTQLPASLGSFLLPRDDLAFELANVSYSIHAKLLGPSPTNKPSKTLAQATRRFHVLPASEEAPPLLVLKESQYLLSKSKTMRKGMFGGNLGTITLTASQPRAFSLPPPRICGPLVPSSPTDLTLTLHFDPTDPSCEPPRLGALSAWIRATTVHSINPASRIPDQELGSPYDSHSRTFKACVELAAQDGPAVAAPLWRVVPAPKYARGDSGYSSAESLSPSPSPRSSSTPLAASMGLNVSVSAASANEDEDELGEMKPYYTTTITLRLALAPSKTWIPTFHSCFVSRLYTLLLELVVHPPG
ncbi:hypothetical protein V492_05453, partial [Pseudogymnoascus sp. VKM F-4246]